jgi:hypothetical protein
MSYRLEATYYRTALLLGLVQSEEVHRWAERIIEKDPTPPHELLDLVLHGGRRSAEDTVTVLRQMRSMLRLPAPMYSDLNEALVAHGSAKATGGTIGAWLEQFAP